MIDEINANPNQWFYSRSKKTFMPPSIVFHTYLDRPVAHTLESIQDSTGLEWSKENAERTQP